MKKRNSLFIIAIVLFVLLSIQSIAQQNPCYTEGTVALGQSGTAFNGASVTGSRAFGLGRGTTVSSIYCTAIGKANTIGSNSGYSALIGNNNKLPDSCRYSMIFGNGNEVLAGIDYNVLIGHDIKTYGEMTLGIGKDLILNGEYSAALGLDLTTETLAHHSIAIGFGTKTFEPYSIALSANSIAPALYIQGNDDTTDIGFVGIGNKDPKAMLDVSGNIRITGNENALLFGEEEGNHVTNWGVYVKSGDLRFVETIYTEDTSAGDGFPPPPHYSISILPSLVIEQGTRNIGIGAARPLQKLHVDGNFLINTPNASLLFDDAADPENPNGRWGIKYESSGLNFWKPVRNLESQGEEELNYAIFISDTAGNIGLNTSYPCERLQIGDRWTFHDGGNKIIGYNWDWLSVEGSGYSRRILDGKSCWMSMSETGDIEFSSAPEGVAGESFENQKHSNIWIGNNGNVGIGLDGYSDYNILRNSTSSKLWVKGGITTTEVWVKLAVDWSDFVFDKDYHLRPLSEVESFIKENGHLPEIPDAAEVAEKGINVGEMDAKLLQKIEELTLYVIEQQKQIEEQQKHIETLLKSQK